MAFNRTHRLPLGSEIERECRENRAAQLNPSPPQGLPPRHNPASAAQHTEKNVGYEMRAKNCATGGLKKRRSLLNAVF